MPHIEGVLYCDRCGVEISWAPYYIQPALAAQAMAAHSNAGPQPAGPQPALRRLEYCCQDCAEGRPCNCAERMEIDVDEDRRTPADVLL